MIEIKITSQEAGQRVDKYLLKFFDKATKSFIYKMIRKKNIKLNNQKIVGNELLLPDDTLTVYFSDETVEAFKSKQIQSQRQSGLDMDFLKIVFEDENLLIINKPSNLLSQPKDAYEVSIIDYLEAYLLEKGEYTPGGGYRVGICNRLDKNTTGIIIACKNILAFQAINEAIHHKEIIKIYHGIVDGQLDKAINLTDRIDKDSLSNKVAISSTGEHEIVTKVKPLKIAPQATLCQFQILTGKTHQIRVHLSSIGHPLIGDFKYGFSDNALSKKYQIKFQLLHCYHYEFTDLKGDFSKYNHQPFIAPYNEKFNKLIKELFS